MTLPTKMISQICLYFKNHSLIVYLKPMSKSFSITPRQSIYHIFLISSDDYHYLIEGEKIQFEILNSSPSRRTNISKKIYLAV